MPIRGSTLDLRRAYEPSRLFDDAALEYVSLAQAVCNRPLTLACWGYCDNLAAKQCAMNLGNSGADSPYVELRWAGNVGGDPIQLAVRDDVWTGVAISTTTGYSANSWHHGCAVEIAVNSRAVYVDGGSKGVDVTLLGASTFDQTALGCRLRVAADTYFSGRIFWPCIWNVALTDAEVAALGNRQNPTPPWKIRPESIVAGPNMRTLWDSFQRLRWTPTGTVPANPPWIWCPRRPPLYAPPVIPPVLIGASGAKAAVGLLGQYRTYKRKYFEAATVTPQGGPYADVPMSGRVPQHDFKRWTPVGGIVLWPLGTPPKGWIRCNGYELGRVAYSQLFGVLGTSFGAGDGATTFNIPDLSGSEPTGAIYIIKIVEPNWIIQQIAYGHGTVFG